MDRHQFTFHIPPSDSDKIRKEEENLKKSQRRSLKKVRKLLVSLKADEAMIDAIDQALADNEQW